MSEFKFDAWPTEFRQITQQFGVNPQNYAQFGLPGHEGIDIMATHGSKIFAVAPGEVKVVETVPDKHPYGIHIRIVHQDDYETIYAHFHQALVKVGDKVKAGDLIGLADNTGNSFGSHLHLSLKKKGAKIENWPAGYIDPTPFLLPLMGWQTPAGPYTDGWAYTSAITIRGDLAQIGPGGINLRSTPSVNGPLIDLAEEGTIVVVTGDRRGLYTPVKVPTVALANAQPAPPTPPPTPTTPATDTVDGWGWASNLSVQGSQATVGQFGINLRAEPRRSAANIGLVKGGSAVTITGAANGEYLPLQVRRSDFSGPINVPASGVTQPTPLPPTTSSPSDAVLGWAWTQNLTVVGNQAISGRFGTNLRAAPNRTAVSIGMFNEGGQAALAGQAEGEYTPLRVRPSDITGLVMPQPVTTQPKPLPESTIPAPAPAPIHDTTPGWAFTAQISVAGGMAVAGQFGINLRDAPRRNANNLGFVPANASMIVTGAAQGEYTPVRIDDDILQKPFTGEPVISPTSPQHSPTPPAHQPEPAILGQAKLGLHASADPFISDAEIEEFKVMRPGMIKLLSFHNPESVAKLAANHPNASWIVRAFLDFGGRNISPQQFFNDTISDTKRTLGFLQGRDVVVELHNEPNLVPEGMGSTWKDGAAFAQWWLQVLDLFRKELPGVRFIYPGLSPGSSVRNLKMDHVEFLEASRDAVKAADGLAVHIYWSNVYPMETALGVLDDYISRFREEPVWVTEASNNKVGTSPARKGMEYITFWSELLKRSTVQGVTYFVASASNPQFAEEVWVGRGIAPVVGRR